ncbi:MAG: hypothetical protein ABJA71_08520 [Ginsengibacter sp.]
MFYNKAFPFIIIVTALFIVKTEMVIAQSSANVKWVVEKNSTLRVEGRSNVNRFTCNINEYAEKDTIICFNQPSRSISLTGEIHMDIFSFNCHSSSITKNLRKTLKAREYPKMTIRFLSLQGMPALKNKTELIKGWVEVDLAGIVKRFELNYSFSRALSGYIQLNGGRSFRFSDFKLSPPQKLGGLIKVKDDFDVNFQLILRTV